MKDLMPMLITRDLPATIDFYTKIIGFKIEGIYQNDSEMTWVSLQQGKVVIMFAIPCESQIDEPVNMSGTLYCYLENVDD